jgi:4-amino-4-deoxy-L-arabinose transferase-like glycosyltransferase
VAALAVGVAPISVVQGALFQYVAFDYLWWVFIAYLMVRLLKSGDPRWWLAIGVVIGLGMLTKYTVAFYVAGIAVGVILTPARRHLTSPWLWAGVGLAVLVALPNLLWQAQHDFVSIDFLRAIHERDVRIGRAEGFLAEQLYVCASVLTVPFWLFGLWFYAVSPAGRPYRTLAWMYAVPLILLVIAQGRSYYLAPAYPMLLAAGAVVVERKLTSMPVRPQWAARFAVNAALVVAAGVSAMLMLPISPIGSGPWRVGSSVHDNFVEQIGWPGLAETVAGVYAALPAEERKQTAILAGNYGVAGAINLYGRSLGLPEVISGANSYWQRGYGDPPPRTVIVVGFRPEEARRHFESCGLAGYVSNRYGVQNEESTQRPEIYVCRQPRQDWPTLWHELRRFQ